MAEPRLPSNLPQFNKLLTAPYFGPGNPSSPDGGCASGPLSPCAQSERQHVEPAPPDRVLPPRCDRSPATMASNADDALLEFEPVACSRTSAA